MTLEGNILITGGAGTLGRAIVRTAFARGWLARFTIYSRGELLQAQMRALYPHCRYIIGGVEDYERLEAAMAGHDVVVHAAAMKRVPECEQQPAACYRTNVLGSQNVVRAAIATGIKRCIGISTDKACRAITAYGASKLAMEKLFLAQEEGPTLFNLVRYGNVVASRGSVIPLWRQQAEAGQPLTVTDPEATRFWMSESDAVSLIAHAAKLQAGTISVPKMGALSLAEMARIIAPGCELKTIGWRSTEKLHEDLVAEDECCSETFDHYILHSAGSTRVSYTSANARRLGADEFERMVEEAEQHEYA
jgi:UDP-N-acetylglucosamine 4,6-dehydratase